jgi:hypothetical protein
MRDEEKDLAAMEMAASVLLFAGLFMLPSAVLLQTVTAILLSVGLTVPPIGLLWTIRTYRKIRS